ALPSGLPILTAGSDNDFTGEIKIENKTGQTTIGEYKTLSAKRYGKEMRAEYGYAFAWSRVSAIGTYFSPDLATIFDTIKNDPNNKDTEYRITVETDVLVGKLTFPGAYKSLEISSDAEHPDRHTIFFTGDLTMKGSGQTKFERLFLDARNTAGVSADYKITASNGDLEMKNVGFNNLTAITANKQNLALSGVEFGNKPVKITSKNFTFTQVDGLIESLTVDTIKANNFGTQTLRMLEKKQSKVNVGIDGLSGYVQFSYCKADGSVAAIPNKTVLFSVFKGDLSKISTSPCNYTRDARNRILAAP
nr:hypothetical protein [Lachnospiraceae bacterium]